MSHRDERGLSEAVARQYGMTRRNLLRQAGLLGVGALGAGVAGCRKAPQQEVADLSTAPTLIQAGGTISGQVSGLLTGAAASFAVLRFLGAGDAQADRQGHFSVRIEDPGDYPVEINGDGFVRRTSRIRVNGSSSVDIRLLENDAGLPMPFLNEFARGTGPTREGVVPRTPGATNRWQTVPRVVLFRGLEDDRDVVPADRVTAMQASIQALFAPLTGNVLGGAVPMEVRPGAPPASLLEVEVGTIVVGQRAGGGLSARHTGSASDPFSIVKAQISCRVDSPIELFNRMFAHALGGWVVSLAAPSILNPAGLAAPSDRDLRAASFLYNRVPGCTAPDVDPAGVFLNA